LIEKIVEDLQDRIVRGDLKEGEKLPAQEKFAETLGVSRGTLREAFNQLVLMGILEMKQGSGTYVKSVTPSSYMNSLSSALLMNKGSAAELLDARLSIEGAVAFLAAKKATEEDIRGLGKVIDGMREDLREGRIEDYANRDIEFHFLVAKSSKNRVLMKVVETIRDSMYQLMAEFYSTMPNIVKLSMGYHQKILRAIEAHDPVEARKQMESHIHSLVTTIHRSGGKLFKS